LEDVQLRAYERHAAVLATGVLILGIGLLRSGPMPADRND
jgi:hypothetical protein